MRKKGRKWLASMGRGPEGTVDEAVWNSCVDPTPMLEFLWGRASERKLRLFAVACCRSIRPLLTREVYRQVVEVAEQYAEGEVADQVLDAARESLRDGVEFTARLGDEGLAVTWAAQRAEVYNRQRGTFQSLPREAFATEAASYARLVKSVRRVHAGQVNRRSASALVREGCCQTVLLRCIFGPLPFRSVPINESWLHWSDGTVVKIAQAIYDERRFEDVPILADALEESGCSDAELLGHLRGPGPHVRGCWVLDLLLQKD